MNDVLQAASAPLRLVDVIEAVLMPLATTVLTHRQDAALEEEIPEDAVPLAVSLMVADGRLEWDSAFKLRVTDRLLPLTDSYAVTEQSERMKAEPPTRSGRTDFQIDRDRILYSSWFRRLAGVTQVIPSEAGLQMHNRLIHSLKVAQIARELLALLQRNHPDDDLLQEVDADAVEACALAHDLGHPPFGHTGERALQDALRERNVSFEGNAQSFRIVTRLATGPPQAELRGLNLTRATLNGMLKYPFGKTDAHDEHAKFGFYAEDQAYFDFARHAWPKRIASAHSDKPGRQRSIESEIMDWSDDIAYAVHDLEDFYRGRVIPFAMLATSSGEQERFARSFLERKGAAHTPDMVEEALSELFYVIAAKLRQPFDGTTLARANLREVAIDLTVRLLNAVSIHDRPTREDPQLVVISAREQALAEVLKHLMFHYVIQRPPLATIQCGQRGVVEGLLGYYLSVADYDPESKASWQVMERLPHQQRLELRRAGGDRIGRQRTIVDFIAGMTEPQAVVLHRRLVGVDSGSLLDPMAG